MTTPPIDTTNLGQLLSAAAAIVSAFVLSVLYGWSIAVVSGKRKT
jgi:hypothetical protein